MIPLRGRATAVALSAPLTRDVWALTSDPEALGPGVAYLCADPSCAPRTAELVLAAPGSDLCDPPCSTVTLPAELNHLGDGDVISLSPDGTRIGVMWRAKANINSILLTERCDNYCVMCSQPPRDRDDSYLIDRARRVIDAVAPNSDAVMFTGGEPTVYGLKLIELLSHVSLVLPEAGIHVLSNGRRFSDPDFAAAWAEIPAEGLMVGIPIYGTEPTLHDTVVGAAGAFDETVHGILNLVALGARVEVRVVIHAMTAPELVAIAEFIARNLPFVDHVALMGLEMIGLARANQQQVWIDPWDYRAELSDAVRILTASGVPTRIYNHQLCLIDIDMWPHAVRSISDWKNEYDPRCAGCAVKPRCGGFFSSAKYGTSAHVRPFTAPPPMPSSNGLSIELDSLPASVGAGDRQDDARYPDEVPVSLKPLRGRSEH